MGEWYRGANMLVVLAGAVGEEARDLVEEKFGRIAGGEISPYVTQASYGTTRQYHLKKKTEQAHFLLGVPALAMDDPRRYALQLGQIVLGGGMSSRLFNEIREKRGLAYYVKAELDTSYDVGYLAVRAGVKLDKLGEAMQVARYELLRLGETVTEQELVRAKEFLLGRLTLSLEESMGLAQFFGTRALILDQVRQPEEVVAQVKGVTLEEVQAVLQEIVKESEIRQVVVGPKSR